MSLHSLVSQDAFERAISYPYFIPSRSYVVSDGGHEEIGGEISATDLAGREPVLAVGSNQSPEQLTRKFVGPDWGTIPVIRVKLSNFDIAYSPHITSYGSIPSTLQSAPGVTVNLFVNWLTPKQIERMHETEIGSANYVFGRLENLELGIELGPSLDFVHVYVSRRGVLCHEGSPISVSEIPATGRTWLARTQEQVQRHIRDQFNPGKELREFICGSIADPDLRRKRTKALEKKSQSFKGPGFVPIEN